MNTLCPKKSMKLNSFTLPVFLFAGLFLLGTFLTSIGKFPGPGSGQVLSKKTEVKVNTNKPKGNSQSANIQNKNKQNTDITVSTKGNPIKEKNKITTDSSTDTTDVDVEIVDTQEDTDEIIEDITTAPKWQTLLFGTGYKNLGSLRSQLARNTNTIRKLNKEMVKNDGSGDQLRYQEQIGLMQIEQQRIKNIIQAGEEQFSLLGWVYKIFGIGDKGVDTDGTGDNIETDESDDVVETPGTSDVTE